MRFDLRTDHSELDEGLARLADRITNPRGFYGNVGIYLRRQTRKNFERGGRPKKWPVSFRAKEQHGKTLMDTNRLAGSIGYHVEDDGVVIGTNVKHAAIHQFGGVIKPKNAKVLTVPLNDIARGKRAREFDDLFVLKREGKAPLLVRRKGKQGKLEAMYVLLKKVRIPARPFLVWLKEYDKAILDELEGWVEG